ncbi:nucleolar protein Nop52, putative [Plasmodium vinckei brucechwatti]|uniref:Nucleolar protein Nop52, putative n=1 Tax=Plasmodium vinckei brucechwatti TaxID=119398 RepID=A0A6V7S2J0_PLAVN|nr:nucleolar protein Nop52, putative [Plasmodium vinckei brucechwatti]
MNNSEIKKIFVQLSHVNKENRDNGMDLVYEYIEKNKNTLNKKEITYICTGLFYYYWLCYSIDEQKKSALKICRLIHIFDGKAEDHDKNHVFLFLQCFLQTMSVKYENLDVYRLNKFLFLFRVFQAEFLMFLHNYSWKSIYIKKYNKIIMKLFDDTNDVFHAYIDTFFKEFMENEVYLKLKKEDHGYNTKQFLLLIDPFFKIVCKTKKKYTIDLIQKKIFFMVLKINIKRRMLLEKINSYIDICPNKYGSKILRNFYNLFDKPNKKKNKVNIKYKTPVFIANYNNDKDCDGEKDDEKDDDGNDDSENDNENNDNDKNNDGNNDDNNGENSGGNSDGKSGGNNDGNEDGENDCTDEQADNEKETSTENKINGENNECDNESVDTEGEVMDEKNENDCLGQKAKKKNKKNKKLKKIKAQTNKIMNDEDEDYINMLLNEINGSKKKKKIYNSLFGKNKRNRKIPLSFIKLMLKEMHAKKKKIGNKFKQIDDDTENNDIFMKQNGLKKKKKKLMLMPNNQTINTEFELDDENKKLKKEKLLKKKDKKVKKGLKKTLLIHEPRLGDQHVLSKTILKKEKTKSSTPKKVHFDLKKNTIEYIPCAKKKNVNSYFFLDNFRNLINIPSFL